jgi:hypothetical protein
LATLLVVRFWVLPPGDRISLRFLRIGLSRHILAGYGIPRPDSFVAPFGVDLYAGRHLVKIKMNKRVMSGNITVTGVMATAPRHLVASEGLEITSFRLASTQRCHDGGRNERVDGDTNRYMVTGVWCRDW